MIVVHHLEDSRSLRVLWLLEELGLPHRIEAYARDAATGEAPESLRRVHPLGRSPVIEHEGRVVAETGAILEYLADLVPDAGWRPAPGSEALQDCRYWLHMGEGSLMPLLLMELVMGRLSQPPIPWIARPITGGIGRSVNQVFSWPRLDRMLTFIDDHLRGRTWFADDRPTIADVMMSFPLEAASTRSNAFKKRPAIQAWLDRVHGREAWQRARAAGGPYAYGP